MNVAGPGEPASTWEWRGDQTGDQAAETQLGPAQMPLLQRGERRREDREQMH